VSEVFSRSAGFSNLPCDMTLHAQGITSNIRATSPVLWQAILVDLPTNSRFKESTCISIDRTVQGRRHSAHGR
jgi:hypothetical protein